MQHVRIRTLVIEDTPRVRAAVKRILNSDADIEAVGSPSDYCLDTERISRLGPDVVTLPNRPAARENFAVIRGCLIELGIPTVIMPVRPEWDEDAQPFAAVPGVPYLRQALPPFPGDSYEAKLIASVRAAASGRAPKLRLTSAPVKEATRTQAHSAKSLIAIGASTGGTQAIAEVLRFFPAECPPVLIVQHMPAGFTSSFARGLDRTMAIEVKEAADGDEIIRGRALIAPGGFHMRAVRDGLSLRVAVTEDDAVNRHRPSVDVLFHSLAAIAGTKIAAALLTGMGADGAIGLNRLHASGARTIAQDEASCIVFGMPREAIKLNAADVVLPLDKIGAELLAMIAPGWEKPVTVS